MNSSFGSYSSMSSPSAPLSIQSSNVQTRDSTCAYPSWVRRTSFSESGHEESRATSYLSDDDLFLSSPFEDDNQSISSTSSSSSPATTAVNSLSRVAEDELLQKECERVAMQQEYLRQVKMEKERRRQAALRARKGSPKKCSNTASLTPIKESSE